MERVVELGAVMGAMLTLASPVVWAALLNLRDRREARLLQGVLAHVSAPELRGRVAVRVRCGVLLPGRVVRVHVLSDSQHEIWQLLARLSEHVSPRIRLDVTGPVDQPFLATFTLEQALPAGAR